MDIPRKRAVERTVVTQEQIGKAVSPRVSAKTVSLALRGDPAVSKPIAAKIQAKALEMGYVPRRVRSEALGLIVPFVAHLTYAELIASIRSLAASRGILVLIGESTGNLELERRLLAEFSRRGVDGVILVSPRMPAIEIDNSARLQQPIVTVFTPVYTSTFQFGSVAIDNEAGARAAVEHLLLEGHERIVYLAGRQISASDVQRRRGYQLALESVQLKYDKPLVVEIGWEVTQPWPSFETGYMQCQQMLERRMNPDAIFAYNDMTAVGAIKALRENGKRVPEDISVVGFDNVTLGQYSDPPLTTVGVQRDEMALKIVDMLRRMAQATDASLPPQGLHYTLPPDLIHRKSVLPRHRKESVGEVTHDRAAS